MDVITVKGITALGTHGVLDSEHINPQKFVVDAQIYADLSKAGKSDNLSDTIDYGQIASRIVTIIEGDHCDLIEALADRIATSILKTSSIKSVQVTVHKPQAPLSVSFDDVSVTIERSQANLSPNADNDEKELSQQSDPISHTVVISMGGNVGDPQEAMRSAVVSLDGMVGNQVTGISPLYSTSAWGMKKGTPDFLNAVIELSTLSDPQSLLSALNMIEAAHGRTRAVHWDSRPLDLDIIDFDGLIQSNPNLTLPHPRAWQRAFVLAPWNDLDPHAVLVGRHGGKVADLLAACPDKDTVKKVSENWILGDSVSFEEETKTDGTQS